MAAECEGAIGVERGRFPGVDFGDHLAADPCTSARISYPQGARQLFWITPRPPFVNFERDDAVIDVVEFGQARFDQNSPGCMYCGDFLTGRETGRHRNRVRRDRGKGRRWCAGSYRRNPVAADSAEHLDHPDRPGSRSARGRGRNSGQPALEADLERNTCAANGFRHGQCVFERSRHGFLGEDGLTRVAARSMCSRCWDVGETTAMASISGSAKSASTSTSGNVTAGSAVRRARSSRVDRRRLKPRAGDGAIKGGGMEHAHPPQADDAEGRQGTGFRCVRYSVFGSPKEVTLFLSLSTRHYRLFTTL